MTTKKHWAAEKPARDRLIAFGNQHGLDAQGILEILSIEKLSEHTGTEAEAVATIAQWAQDNAPPDPQPDEEPAAYYETPTLTASDEDQGAYFEACTRLPEAPIVAWTVFQDAQGFEWSYTIRAGLPAPLAATAHELVAVELAEFQANASRYGWEPLIDSRRVGNGTPKAPALALVQPSGNGDNTFQATHLKADTINDKTYWSVLGPRFPKHGVRIWPEVLEAAGFKEADLDTTQPVVLNGYTATYVEKDKDGKMVTDKVISLTKAA